MRSWFHPKVDSLSSHELLIHPDVPARCTFQTSMNDWHRPPPRGSYMFIVQPNTNFWLRPKFILDVWNLQRCRPFFLFRYWFLGSFVDSELKFARHFCDMVRRNKEYESNQGENHELILRRAISARPIRKAPWANCGPVFFMFRRSIRS